MIRQNRTSSLITAILITLVILIVAPGISAQNYSACGRLQMGLDCMQFVSFSGQTYLIQNWGPFKSGDTVHVMNGTVTAQWCMLFQQAAIVNNTICAGSAACAGWCPCCVGTTGNINGTPMINIVDLARLVSYLTGGANAIQCMGEADINASGTVDLADMAALVTYLTGGGYQFPACPAGS